MKLTKARLKKFMLSTYACTADKKKILGWKGSMRACYDKLAPWHFNWLVNQLSAPFYTTVKRMYLDKVAYNCRCGREGCTYGAPFDDQLEAWRQALPYEVVREMVLFDA